jgi:cation transport ATPase
MAERYGIEVADIALMNDKLSLIPFLIRLSKKRY